MSAWAELPNAVHIDRVLADVRRRPQVWGAALGAAWGAARGSALDAALDAALGAAWDAAWDAARGAARVAARDAAWDAARDAARGAAWVAARVAVAVLVAWDDAADVLSLPVPAVRLLAASGHHAAMLLLPAVIALEDA